MTRNEIDRAENMLSEVCSSLREALDRIADLEIELEEARDESDSLRAELDAMESGR